MASPNLLLLCLWNRSWSTQKNVGGPPSPDLTSACSPSLHLCLLLSCPGFLTISSPYFTPISACGVTGLQRAPVTSQIWRDSNGGAEKPRYAWINGPVRGPLWGWVGLALILCRKFTDTYLGIAFSVSIEEECKDIAV